MRGLRSPNARPAVAFTQIVESVMQVHRLDVEAMLLVVKEHTDLAVEVLGSEVLRRCAEQHNLVGTGLEVIVSTKVTIKTAIRKSTREPESIWWRIRDSNP